MKQKTIISWFLMAVCTIMLMASVLPHHHHRELLCLQQDIVEIPADCNSESCAHDHSDDASNENNTSQCETCCITKFHCPRPDHSYDSMEPHYALEAILFTFTDIYLFKIQPKEKQAKIHTFYHETLHSKYFAKATGLRAPPYFIA